MAMLVRLEEMQMNEQGKRERTILSRRVQTEIDRYGLRQLEGLSSVNRQTLRTIADDLHIEPPRTETMQKLSRYFKVPLYTIYLWAGIDLQLPKEFSDLSGRLAVLSDSDPQFAEVVRALEGLANNPAALDAIKRLAQSYYE